MVREGRRTRKCGRAQFLLGLMYDRGRGVPQDYKEAAKWYRKAAEQGDSLAQGELGWLYNVGKGVVQDDKEAAKWYAKAAEQGTPADTSYLEERSRAAATNRSADNSVPDILTICRARRAVVFLPSHFTISLLLRLLCGVWRDTDSAGNWCNGRQKVILWTAVVVICHAGAATLDRHPESWVRP